MSRFIHNLHPGEDRRFCHQCGRPANLFGSRDIETGWEGWCTVCNADWHYHKVVSPIRCCSRVFSVASPVMCGFRFHMPAAIAINIQTYLRFSGATVHTLTMRQRKCTLQLLEWTSARLDWFLADDSSDEFALDDPVTLLSLRHEPLCRCFDELDYARTLLEYVYTFLSPCFVTVLHSEYHVQEEEVGWKLYHFSGRLWLWNNDTALWFFVDEPPSFWCRYSWFVDFPRTAFSLKYWWRNADGGRWFWEPTVSTLQQAPFEALDCPSVGVLRCAQALPSTPVQRRCAQALPSTPVQAQ